MVKHSMDIVRKAVQHLNAGQTPLVTFAKQIQWKELEMYGKKFIVMIGSLHKEMAAMRTLCDWLQGSGWVEALVQAEITTAGTADSLCAAHVARTRCAHQVTVVALYLNSYPTQK